MRQNPPKQKLPRKLSINPRPKGVGRVETDADDLSGPAHTESARSANRASRLVRLPKRHPRSDASYVVGYCRPPKDTQFKPGQSGNSKGRSPQSRNLKTIVKQVLGEQVQIREGGRVRRMPKIEAFFRTIMSRAFKGDPKATASFIVVMKHSGYGIEAVENTLELLHGVDHEAILEEYLARLVPEDSTEVGSSSDDSTKPSDPSKKGKA